MRALLLLAVLSSAGVWAGCASAQARTETPMPELAPPPPPPRIVADYDQPAPAEPVARPGEPTTPVTPQPSGATRRETPPARPEPAPAPPPATPRPAAPPSLTLTPAPGTEAQTQASIRAIVARAGQDLAKVNYAALDADRRTQYDTARRFVQQAEAALKEGNLVFAGKLADKAATMAAVLVR